MDLNDYRKEIDQIDDELIALFAKRMETAEKIAAYKQANGLRVLDARHEKEKMRTLMEKTPEDLREYVSSLYSLIFELSRSRQSCLLGARGDLPAKIAEAIEKTPHLFPQEAAVACQGVEGAYSEQACEKLFKRPNTFFFSSFEAVFSAIEKGLCRYGVLPLENSTAGSVNAVYDLMMRHNFRIVRSVRIKIDHNLLANPGAKIEDIREIYSHEQAISQCAHFLQGLPNVKVIRCENTAVAARMVAESGRSDVAALSSRACMDLYGLENLAASVLISPEELKLPSYVKAEALKKNNIPYEQTTDLESVMPQLDILYMTRVQRERFFNEEDYLRLKDSYILTPEKLKTAKPDLCILHPLPRVNEISVAVDDDPRACYFKQVKNGRYIRMALILKLLGIQ